jgi:hypothetical protein
MLLQIQKKQEPKYMPKNKKETRGGKRSFSGRKKADYETKTIAFRVRVEFVEPIKKMVKDYVSERLKGDA